MSSVEVGLNQREALLLRSFSEYGIIAMLWAVSVPFFAKAEDRVPCSSATLGSFDIAAVIDGRSFKLLDGREALLAGVMIPIDDSEAKDAETGKIHQRPLWPTSCPGFRALG
jgi:hypothetical protein